MRFFKKCDNWAECIAGEMINIETGKHYFTNGKLIPLVMKDGNPEPRPAYLIYTRSKRTITVKYAAEGLIYMPIKVRYNEVEEVLRPKLKEMYKLAGYADENAVLLERRPIHTASGHFTSVTTMTAPKSDNDLKIRNMICCDGSVFRITSHTRAIFTWYYITEIRHFIDLILDYAQANKIPVYLQLLGIFYDPNNVTRFAHDQRYDSNMTLKDLRWTGNLIPQCMYGDINDVMKSITVLKQEDRDVAKDARRKKPAAKAPAKALTDAQKETYDLIGTAFRREYDNYHGHPGYFPGFNRDDVAIKLCIVRGPFFEIARWLGTRDTFGPMVPIDTLFGMTIYEVEYKQIKWPKTLRGPRESLPSSITENADFAQLKPQDFCQRCRTPIYDRGYAVFDNHETNMGIPYCVTCMHLRYNEHRLVDPKGSLLCKDMVLAHYKAPLTLEQVLNFLPNQNPTYRAILTETYDAYKHLSSENEKKGDTVLMSKSFIGITESLQDYDRMCAVWEKAGHVIPIKPVFMCSYVRIW